MIWQEKVWGGLCSENRGRFVGAYEGDALREAIWSRYELQLIEQMREEQVTTFAVDDDVTF